MSIEARFRLSRGDFALDVDLRLPGRGVTALFGASGCGKTTLLRCIAGLERAVGGRLVIGDETWQDANAFLPTHRRAIGYVFQENALFPHLDVRANLLFGRRRRPVRDATPSLDELLALLGIGHLLDRPITHLSGGEQQRVAIARALAAGARLLLLDEPLAALDAKRKREILPYLEKLHDTLSIPVLYVSHAIDEVARLADHVVVLDAGRSLASGPLAEVMSRLDLPFAQDDDAGVVIDATVRERDARWHIVRATFAGGDFWVRDAGFAPDRHLRLRVLARDVSLALSRHADTSILNALAGRIDAIAPGTHPAVVLVRIDVGGTPVLARVTARSVDVLGLTPGKEVWVQVKSVAVIE